MASRPAAPREGDRAVSLADQAYAILRDRLVMLDIPPGSAMNEVQLTNELGMGRTPIRESLKRLEVDHLVVSYPRQGTFASPVDIRDLAAISEVRTILEPHAARRAAESASDDQRREMQAIARELEELAEREVDIRELIEFDLEVHRAIYRALDNPHLQETLVRLDNLATRLWWTVLHRMPTIAVHTSEHIALLDAVVAGHADRAGEIAHDHVVNFDRAVRAAL